MNIEICCCMGGMAEGFKRAGITFDVAIDKDPAACDSYEANHGHRPVQMDVHDLLRLARLGAFRPDVDLLVADPPCTPWSMAGKRQGLDDERDLLREVVDLIITLRPRRAVIGNVPGLDRGDNWRDVVLPVIYQPLEAINYHIDYASFDAADYGVPQHRVRPFWFIHAVSQPCVRWPLPTHADPASPPALPGLALKPWVSCGQALEAAFGARAEWGPQVGRSVRMRRRAANSLQHGSVTGAPARTLGRSNLSDGNVIDDADEHARKARRAGRGPRASVAERPARVVTARENGDGCVLVDERPVVTYSADFHPPMREDQPGNTVSAGARGGSPIALLLNDKHPPNTLDAPSSAVCAKHRGGAQGAISLVLDPNRPPHPGDAPARTVTSQSDHTTVLEDKPIVDEHVYLWSSSLHPPSQMGTPANTVPAAMPTNGGATLVVDDKRGLLLSETALLVLQGFPLTWTVAGKTKTARMSQIGQAMPPALAEAVARAIVEQIRRTKAT